MYKCYIWAKDFPMREAPFLWYQTEAVHACMEHLWLTVKLLVLSRSIHFSVVTPYFKGKLKGIYSTALSDAQAEAKLLQDALEKITEIKTYKAKAGLFLDLFFNSSYDSHCCHQNSDDPILSILNDETIALYIGWFKKKAPTFEALPIPHFWPNNHENL